MADGHEHEPDGGHDQSISDDEFQRFRGRMHKLADTVQAHTVTLAEHRVTIAQMQRQLSDLLGNMSTRDQLNLATIQAKQNLDSAMLLVAKDVKTVSDNLDGRVKNINDALAKIQSAINWTAMLIVGAVVVALLSLVIKGQ